MSDIDIKFNCDVTPATRSFTQIKTAAAESLNMIRVDLGKFSQYSEQEAVKRVEAEKKILKQKEGMYKLHFSNLTREEKQAYQEAIRHQKMVLDQAKVIANEEVTIYKNKLDKMKDEAKRFADAQKNIMKSIASEISGIMGGLRSALSFGGIAGIAGFMGSTLSEDRQFSKHIRSIRAISDENDRKIDLRKELTSTSNITGVNKNDLALAINTYKKEGGSISPGIIGELGTQLMLNPDMDVSSYAGAAGSLRGAGLSEKQQIDLMRSLQIQTRSPGADLTAEQVAKPAIEAARFGIGFGVGTNRSMSENIAASAATMQIVSGTMSADEAGTGMRQTMEFAKNNHIDVGTGNTEDAFMRILEQVKSAGGGDVAKGAQSLDINERALKFLVQFSEGLQTADDALKENIDINKASAQIEKEMKEQQAETWQSIDKSFNEIKNTVADALAPALKSFAANLANNKDTITIFFEYIGKLAEWAAKNPFEALLLLNVDKLASFVNIINKLSTDGPPGPASAIPAAGTGWLVGKLIQENVLDPVDKAVFGHKTLPGDTVGTSLGLAAGGAVLYSAATMMPLGRAATITAGLGTAGLWGAGVTFAAGTGYAVGGELANGVGSLFGYPSVNMLDNEALRATKNFFEGKGFTDEDTLGLGTMIAPHLEEMKKILTQLNSKVKGPETKKSDVKNGNAHFSGTHAFHGTTTFGQVIIMHNEDRSGVH